MPERGVRFGPVAHPRPFRFGLQASGPMPARRVGRAGPEGRVAGLLDADLRRPPGRPVRPGPGPRRGRRGHHDAAPRDPGPGQRLPAPGRGREGRGHPRPAVRRPPGARARSGLDDLGLRDLGHPPRPRRACASTAWPRGWPSSGASWPTGRARSSGEHYQVTGLEGFPKPVQRPHPPIVIGGGGPRVLRFAAREADIVGINVNLAVGVIDERAGPNATEEATQAKVDLVREAAATASTPSSSRCGSTSSWSPTTARAWPS